MARACQQISVGLNGTRLVTPRPHRPGAFRLRVHQPGLTPGWTASSLNSRANRCRFIGHLERGCCPVPGVHQNRTGSLLNNWECLKKDWHERGRDCAHQGVPPPREEGTPRGAFLEPGARHRAAPGRYFRYFVGKVWAKAPRSRHTRDPQACRSSSAYRRIRGRRRRWFDNNWRLARGRRATSWFHDRRRDPCRSGRDSRKGRSAPLRDGAASIRCSGGYRP